jgi:hypothetical protein
VNDDLRLSLFLDGRLPGEEHSAFERRLEAEPLLRARLEAMRRLQALSAGLAPASAAFSADDVRVRAELAPGGGLRRWGLAAAAVLALAATHAGVYWAGARRGAEEERAARRSIEATEALLDRAAEMDIAAPPAELESELDTIRREIPNRLVALSRARGQEAARLADVLAQIDLALDARRDPAFACLQVKAIVTSLEAGAHLRLVPATATRYTQVLPTPNGRFQVVSVENVNGTPRTFVAEVTREDLEATRDRPVRHPADKKGK